MIFNPQIVIDQRCNRVVRNIFGTMAAARVDHITIGQAYYYSLLPYHTKIEEDIQLMIEHLDKPNMQNVKLGIELIIYMTYYDIENFFSTFRNDLKAVGVVKNPDAQLHGEVGQTMIRYCSKHMLDVERIRAAILAGIGKSQEH